MATLVLPSVYRGVWKVPKKKMGDVHSYKIRDGQLLLQGSFYWSSVLSEGT